MFHTISLRIFSSTNGYSLSKGSLGKLFSLGINRGLLINITSNWGYHGWLWYAGGYQKHFYVWCNESLCSTWWWKGIQNSLEPVLLHDRWLLTVRVWSPCYVACNLVRQTWYKILDIKCSWYLRKTFWAIYSTLKSPSTVWIFIIILFLWTGMVFVTNRDLLRQNYFQISMHDDIISHFWFHYFQEICQNCCNNCLAMNWITFLGIFKTDQSWFYF